MTQQPFRSSLFAILESFAPQLLAGPDARTQQRKAVSYPAGTIPIVGILGQRDWYVATDYADIRQSIQRAVKDPHVSKIILAVDSPGGSVLGLPETGDAIHAASKVKPVHAIVPGIAASAAYWLASQASTISLTPSGEVGSVGVLDLHADVTKMLDEAGVKLTAVHAGEHKVERAPFTTLSDEARSHMQRGVDSWYADFLSAVRRGRGARVSASSNYGGGRMLPAKAALASGLVDFIGGAL